MWTLLTVQGTFWGGVVIIVDDIRFKLAQKIGGYDDYAGV